FQPPPAGKTPYSVATGDDGLRSLRDRFFSRHAADERAILQYTRVTVLAQWLDYGVVTIDRPMERQGAMQLREGQGGATYLFHRVQGEWRLLAIVRTWS
ncbi:MAG: hypothetical protein K2X99_09265, partial [Gemmatimonadaceae bacterium]|nr:hypothetical protein [Gemmatimonadaceae bacterium]